MRKTALALTLLLLLTTTSCCIPTQAIPTKVPFKLGNEVLFERYMHLLADKRVGLITNHTGVNSQGQKTYDLLAQDARVNLVALFAPEHGLDGQAKAGQTIERVYTHPTLQIPVYGLYGYGDQRRPSQAMLQDVDVLLYDIQDIGARSYTYISTLRYCMEEAKKYNIPVIVLDRPNPVGGTIVEGPLMEERFVTFVGVDIMPIAHGMTVGELARYFNRNIGVKLQVVPMEGYTRDMIWQDTGLNWVPTSPSIPDIDAAFSYMATGMGYDTGVGQQDTFKWLGGVGIDAQKFANLLNGAKLPGVTFVPEVRGNRGGVRLQITDYHRFNPSRTGLYALAYAQSLNHFQVPKSGSTQASIVMFDKIMGTDKIGQWLEQGLTPQQIEARYQPGLQQFKQIRPIYLLYADARSAGPQVVVDNVAIFCDVAPFIDANSRTLVPYRALGEALGAQVHWDNDTRAVTLRKGERVVKLTVGQPTVYVDGQALQMNTVPVIKGNRTMVPIRYASELLGAFVHWEQATRTVIVRSAPK